MSDSKVKKQQNSATVDAISAGANLQASKYFTLSETGNIIVSSTSDNSQTFSPEMQKIFAEVSVFFSGMARAITNTPNPHDDNKPYSLFNYNAISNVITGSGLFVKVLEEDLTHKTSSFGTQFSVELLEGLLGLADGNVVAGLENIASSLIKSMGSAGLKISSNKNAQDTKVANIFFFCENLLGIPSVSASVISMDAKEHSQQLKAGPCFSEKSKSTTLTMTKETYLFVPPSFITAHAKDLNSVESNVAYTQFIDWLQTVLKQTPNIFQVINSTSSDIVDSGTALSIDSAFILQGEFLPTENFTMKFVGTTENAATGVVTPKVGKVNSSEIGFSVSGTQTTPLPIGIYLKDKLVIASPGTFTIADASTSTGQSAAAANIKV